MARPATAFVCQACGATRPKWSGRCDGCGEWNTLVEELRPSAVPKGLDPRRGRRLALVGLEGEAEPAPRLTTGIGEFDRVCGGGLVPGSVLLVGGDPGIGKSTLLLQVAAALAATGGCAYVSGEEAIEQLRLRAVRLGLSSAPVGLLAATSVRDIAATFDRPDPPAAVVVDSIQTLYVDTLDSAPGTVAQVRSSVQELVRLAKTRGFVLFLVGHVTKEGLLAGPRVVEHLVDCVLYFEGERGHAFRILRTVKNRFGGTDEIGVFQMSDRGLVEVLNPSELFLADRESSVPGCCVFAGIEGSRPVLVEVQALVAPSAYGTPRRAAVGWDQARLAMVIAVLESRCGLAFGAADVYLNIAGGLRIVEPAADLAVAAALVSAGGGVPVSERAVAFGEIGLAGEVRAVARTEARLKEAAKLGFSEVIMPVRRGRPEAGRPAGLAIWPVSRVDDLVARLAADTSGHRRPTQRG